VLELADVLVVNKADGDQAALAERTRSEYAHALVFLRPASAAWTPRVVTASARTGAGIEEFFDVVLAHRAALEGAGELQARRCAQARAWLWSLVEQGLRDAFRGHPAVAALIPALEREVEAQRRTPASAAALLLEAFRKG
jgi:LAO/AO transport system kinase